jgi:hypothetical protein
MGLLRSIVKSANTTYSYSAATSRNFIPAPADKPIKVNINTGERQGKADIKQHLMPGTPKKSENKPFTGMWYSEMSFLHPFTPTVSGTGSGHKYWAEPKNPFDV